MSKENKEAYAYLLCPFCFNRIPRIQLVKENNEISIQTFCDCRNEENKMLLSKYNKIMSVSSNRLDPTRLIFQSNIQFCSNCLSFFCDDSYNSHIQSCINRNDKDTSPTPQLKVKADSIWYCKQCSLNICYKCKSNERHKYHSTRLYLTENALQEMVRNMLKYSNDNEKNNQALLSDITKHINERIKVLKGWKESIERYYIISQNANKEMAKLLAAIESTVRRSNGFCYNHTIVKNIHKLYCNGTNTEYNCMKTIREFSNDLDNKYHEMQQYFSNSYILPAKPICCIKEVWKINKFQGEVNSMIQLSNGRLAVASNENIIKIFEVFTTHYSFKSNLIGHTDCVQCLIELRDGRVASGSMDLTIKLWNVYTYKCLGSLLGSDDTINCLIQLHNDNLLSGDYSLIRIWDIKAYLCIISLECHPSSINCILQLPNHTILSADKIMKLWNPACTICLHESIEENEIVKMIQTGNEQFAVLNVMNVIKIWNYNIFQCVLTISMGMNNHVTLIKSNDGRLISMGDSVILVWDASFKRYEEIIFPFSYNDIFLQLKNKMLVCSSFFNSIAIMSLD